MAGAFADRAAHGSAARSWGASRGDAMDSGAIAHARMGGAPRVAVVGVDGSHGSAAALAHAQRVWQSGGRIAMSTSAATRKRRKLIMKYALPVCLLGLRRSCFLCTAVVGFTAVVGHGQLPGRFT